VEQAQDLTQEFFARLLEKRYIDRADRNKGRFRSFLLSSLKYFLSDETDRRNAEKRGGVARPLAFEVQAGEERYRLEPFHNETPERIFERRWALALLERVLCRLQEEFAQAGKAAHFERLKSFLGGRSEVPYAQLAHDLGVAEGAIRVAVHRFRRRYRDLLREEIAETVSTPGEIDEEIRCLLRAVRAAELGL
jgi:RNA polymerase sigma-70 factor (ECF subfamily)